MTVEYSALIVDDDIWMQRILSKAMQSYGFTKILLASNGFEGIALAVEHTPHIVIMDILMPEMSGHLTLKVLKHIHSTKDIPIIMVSALSDSENLRLAVKYGTAGFISKPFTRVTIYEKLLAVYGKENLELIAKGEPILDSYDFSDDFDLSTESIAADEEDSSLLDLSTEVDIFESEEMPAKVSIPREQLMQSYQQDEKNSIESIKKLLLKIKK